PAYRWRARSRDLYARRHRPDHETLGRRPARREHPVRSLSGHRVRRSEAIDRARCRPRGLRLSRRRAATKADVPSDALSLRSRARGTRPAGAMSKFIEALEQAERDRALGQPREVAAVSTPVAIDDVPSEPAPIAEVPDGARVLDQHLVSLLKPTSFEAEQYRTLRHLIEHLHRTAELSVVAVSSAVANDGKTTTAINLAGALAQDPHARVLLVDADLRRGDLARHVGMHDDSALGLVDAILDVRLPLDAVVRRRAPFNLSVVSAGTLPSAPYEVLKLPRV